MSCLGSAPVAVNHALIVHRNYASWKRLIFGSFNPDAKLVSFASAHTQRLGGYFQVEC